MPRIGLYAVLVVSLTFGSVIAIGCGSSTTTGTVGTNDGGTQAHDTGSAADNPSGFDTGALSDTGAGSDTGSTGGDSGVCDPVKQTGCPGSDKCAINPQPVCVANGTKTVGQICGTANVDDCVAGYLCSTDTANGVRTCEEICAGDADCKEAAVGPAGNTPHCLIQLSTAPEKLCTVPCNPVTAAGASGCATGLACSYGGTASIPEITACETPGAGTDGTTCTSSQNCSPGFTCVTGSAGSSCRQVCRAATPADCTATTGYACDALTGATMFGLCCPTAGC